MKPNKLITIIDVESAGKVFEAANLKLDQIFIHLEKFEQFPYTYKSPTSPLKYLKFAKKELHGEITEVALINAINHTNKSIDSLINEFLKCLSIDTTDKKTIKSVDTLFKKYTSSDYHNDMPLNLKLLASMLHAPTLLVDSARKVRHRTEHEYTIPAVIDVLTAVEAAQFFYLFVESKTSSVGQVDITDIKLYNQMRRRTPSRGYLPPQSTGVFFGWEILEDLPIFYLKFRKEIDENNIKLVNYEFKYDELLLFMFLRVVFFDHFDEETLKVTVTDIFAELGMSGVHIKEIINN
ncbi:MAG: hypothetical protein HRU18_19740 [Pseudoalteromonas sp.]|uniref:hypothetical protein n=1 Tax=Pseudoalteromonas sp. TaxID=53249 RepID=UPI001E06D185|nr:hypothetical protein [Pseudoalteromonas sp.]NRA80440.1 hypothetical protein [Pseudoalteromonas sp.]